MSDIVDIRDAKAKRAFAEHAPDPEVQTAYRGNGAYEAVLAYWQGRYVPQVAQAHADQLLAWLWMNGFKVVPLDGTEEKDSA